MSPPLPIPSKAALRALRGLILGTSCTLALITEDRRRRINHALQILENNERVKAARTYRGGGGGVAGVEHASVLALEEDFAVLDSSLFRLYPRPSKLPGESLSPRLPAREPTTPTTPATPAATTHVRHSSAAAASGHEFSRQDIPHHIDGVPLAPASDRGPPSETLKPFNGPAHLRALKGPMKLEAGHGPGFSRVRALDAGNRNTIRQYRFPSKEEIVDVVHDACRTKAPSQLDSVLQLVSSAYSAGVASKDESKQWIEATALLCRTCQEEGRVEDATKLLSQVISVGELDESDYFTFQPLALIDSLLAQVSPEVDKGKYWETVQACVGLFLARFKETPKDRNGRVFEMGKALLEASFAVDKLTYITGLYSRCIMHGGGNEYQFTAWIIKELHQRGSYKQAFRCFAANYCNMSPDHKSFNEVGDVIVKCVQEGHNNKARTVMRSLLKLAESVHMKLRPEWVIKLLHSYWKKHPQLEDVETLFKELTAVGLRKIVASPRGVYRVMVELALEAGDVMKADEYILEASAEDPGFARHPRLLGLLALFEAKAGNWEAVKKKFEAMLDEYPAESCDHQIPPQKHSDAFVPILKVYTAEHTIPETEQFIQHYISELKVGLSPYMITLVAKMYGAVRDFESLRRWLLYCASALPQIDANAANAILASCQRAKMPFPDIRTLFRKIRALNPAFIDKNVEHIMVNAALSGEKRRAGPARKRVASLYRVRTDESVWKMRYASEIDVRLAMKKLIFGGQPTQALAVYQHAVNKNIPYSDLTLRLAVTAALENAHSSRSHEDCMNDAWKLIQSAQRCGNDVNDVICFLLGRFFDRIGKMCATREDVYEAVRRTMAQHESEGLRITSEALDRAAHACLEARHFPGALYFAHRAADCMQQGLCYNTTNFRILLLAYTELVDEDGVRDTLKRMMDMDHFREDKIVLEAVRTAHQTIKHPARADADMKTRSYVAYMLKYCQDRLVATRAQLRRKQKEFAETAIAVMQQAALDAGCKPVDFQTIPWLNRRELEDGEEPKQKWRLRFRDKEMREQDREMRERMKIWRENMIKNQERKKTMRNNAGREEESGGESEEEEAGALTATLKDACYEPSSGKATRKDIPEVQDAWWEHEQSEGEVEIKIRDEEQELLEEIMGSGRAVSEGEAGG